MFIYLRISQRMIRSPHYFIKLAIGDRIVLKPLDVDDKKVLATFDIRKASCFLQSDRQRLLAIVESSYFSFGAFNSACRKILLSKLRSDEAPSSMPLAEVDGASERVPRGKAVARVAPA